MKIASIHQPHYLSWFGLIDKISKSDVHIILDDVQYNKRSFQHRTLFSNQSGESYLSLSVNSKGAQTQGLFIKDVRISDAKVLMKHFKTLEQRYKKRPGWQELEGELARIYEKPYQFMLDLNMDLLGLTLNKFKLFPEIVFSSELSSQEVKGALMYDLTSKSGCDIYLSGNGALDYMSDVPLEKRKTKVEFQKFSHPIYKQSTGNEFRPGMFALEMLLEEPEMKNYFVKSESIEQPVRCVHA